MLQLIEKILLELAENGNEEATFHTFQKLLQRRSAPPHMTDEKKLFSKICCYAIHELYAVEPSSLREKALIRMMIDLLFYASSPDMLRKYLEISPNDFEARVKLYRRICRKYADDNAFNWIESSLITDALLAIDDLPATQRQQSDALVPHVKTTSNVSTRYVEGRQLLTIKTVVEEEVSMYIDAERECPKFVKICMPDHDEPVFVSRVLKKHVSFARLFNGKSTENTLSRYYKFDTNESTLEFIDDSMKRQVAELLGLTTASVLAA